MNMPTISLTKEELYFLEIALGRVSTNMILRMEYIPPEWAMHARGIIKKLDRHSKRYAGY